MGDTAETHDGEAALPRRNVRPNFAEDVYGGKKNEPPRARKTPPDDSGPSNSEEFSESPLANRRQQLKETLAAQRNLEGVPQTMCESIDMCERDLDFTYSDCDSLSTELSELYSYSELDDFSNNLQCWKNYADRIKLEPPFSFTSLSDGQKRSIIFDLCNRMESAQIDMRLTAGRIMLYILQGSFGDFAEEEEVQAGVPPAMSSEDRGTGGLEADCILQAFENAHLVYSCGGYQALCGLLLTEMVEPFDNVPLDGRDSKASSRDSRHASYGDLSDHGRRKTATLSDNESLRIVLACLYHMVELIRNQELTVSRSESAYKNRRREFLEELGEPIDNEESPLILILFDMMPAFYLGTSPHFPIKKILLLVWKILLATLGGVAELQKKKEHLRNEAGLAVMENTLEVASRISAILVHDGDTAGLSSAKRTGAPRLGAQGLARQMACAGSDESKDEEDEEAELVNITKNMGCEENNEQMSSTPVPNRQGSGDRTPRAGSPMPPQPPKKILPWRSKVSRREVDAFIQAERLKFFNYTLPGDSETLFALPPPIRSSIGILKKHVYTSLSELQAEKDESLNRFRLSVKEVIEMNNVERLYRMLLPNLSQYVVALLKVLLAAAPSTKARSDALNILVDVLTPETDGSDVLSNSISLDNSTSNPLEDSVRLTIDINRHKEVMVKAASSILLLLCKHFKLNHIYQFEYLCQHVVFGNGIPLLLKFLDQNMTRYVQSRHEIHAYNFPQAQLHFVRNREEWPVLNPDNVEDVASHDRPGSAYFLWRNVFSSVNLVRILNKLVKCKQSRVMMLMVFKSAPMLKRSLKIRLGLFQLYILKALKMQSRYLGRQWRRNNMDVTSAIYNKVRHRLTDDWAFANEVRKSYDYHNEESELKAAVERFHNRRYSHIYKQFAIEVTDEPMPGDDYLNRVDMRDFKPINNCFHSVLGAKRELSERFRNNYGKWMEKEVLGREVDWDRLLVNSQGIYNSV